MKKEYDIVPVPKPRMTRRDKWLNPARPGVARYRNFCLECTLKKVHMPMSGGHVTFVLPMPDSWSKRHKDIHDHRHHFQTPDLDNLIKALLDALFEDDKEVCDLRATKIWGREGKIIVETQDHLA